MLALLLAITIQDSTPRVPVPDAYADPAAAVLVAAARGQRDRSERLVSGYTATVTQRIGAGLRALRRDRMLFGQELAARITWRRDAQSTIEVLGARQRIPIAIAGQQLPEDLDEQVRWLVHDPAEDYLRVIGDDAEGWVHPLRDGSERDYRFRSGDTTVIALPGGREIRVVELVVLPRRQEFRLIAGSFWFDAESYGLVRAVFRPARPFDLQRDGDVDDDDDVPKWLNVGADIPYIVLEYGLYEQRWWLLRYVAIEAEATMTGVRVPVRFEREYTDYRVQGGTLPPEGSTFRPAGSTRGERERDSTLAGMTAEQRDSVRQAVRDCIRREVEEERAARDSARAAGTVQVRVGGGSRYDRCRGIVDTALAVVIPADSQALLANPLLGEPILRMGDVVSEQELRQLGRELGVLQDRPWTAGQAQLPGGVVGGLVRSARYNRVEALSAGLGGTLDFGRARLDGSVRLGLADLEPRGEAGIARVSGSWRLRLGGYNRLVAANPDTRPFGPINSFYAFFAGRDDGQYFQAHGGEVTWEPAAGSAWRARLYGERQRSADVNTQVSVPDIWQDTVFGPNIAADPADQFGGAIELRGSRPLGASGTVGAELTGSGETGDYEFGKGALTVRGTGVLGPVAVALEGAAGTSSGGLPVQSRFYLGGPGTLRGYDGGVTSGEAFWRGRAELGTRNPAARLVTFGDWGWAGDRSDFTRGQPLIGAGVGGAFLDGLIRVDLSRGLRAPTGWRFDLYVDGLF